MVSKSVVLLRVEHLQQRGCGIALIARSDLVDLVQHDDRVLGAGFAQGADQLAGQRADVGAAVALDFGFIAHAAYRETMKRRPMASAMARRGRSCQRPGPTKSRIEPPTSPSSDRGRETPEWFLDVMEPVVASVEAAAAAARSCASCSRRPRVDPSSIRASSVRRRTRENRSPAGPTVELFSMRSCAAAGSALRGAAVPSSVWSSW